LKSDPSNAGLKAREEALTSLKTTAEQQQAQRSQGTNEASEQAILTDIAPTYKQNIVQIENSSATAEQKNKQLTAEENKLLSAIDKELSSVKQQLKSDPSNAALQAREESLTNLKATTEQKQSERSQGTNGITTSEQAILTDIAPTYKQNITQIENSSASAEQKNKQIAQEESQLLNTLEENLKTERNKIFLDPTNDDALLREKQLMIVQKKVQQEALQREATEALLQQGNSRYSREELKQINELIPEYSINRLQVEQEKKSDQKAQAILQLERSLLNALKSVQKEKTGSMPSEKSAMLSALIEKVEENTTLLTQQLSQQQSDLISKTDIEKEINQVSEEIGLVSSNDKIQKTPSDKTRNIASSLLKLEQLKVENEQKLENNPTSTELLSRQKAIEEVEQNLLDQRKERQEKAIQNINSEFLVASPEEKESIITELLPSFRKQELEIQRGQYDPLLKAVSQIELEEALIQELEKQLANPTSNSAERNKLMTELKEEASSRKDVLEKSLQERLQTTDLNGREVTAFIQMKKEWNEISKIDGVNNPVLLQGRIRKENELLSRIESQLSELDQLGSEARKILEKELISIQNDLINARNAREETTEKQKETLTQEVTSTRLMDALMPKYTELSNAVLLSDVSKNEKLKAWNALDSRMIALINDSINRLALVKPSNTGEANVFSRQLSDLNALKMVLTENSNQRVNQLVTNNQFTTPSSKSVYDVLNASDPSFLTEVKRIREDQSLTAEEKYERLSNKVANMREKVNSPKGINDAKIAGQDELDLSFSYQTPNTAISASELNAVKKELDALVSEARQSLISKDNQPVKVTTSKEKEIIQALDKNYWNEKEQFDVLPNPTEKEISERIKQEKQLLSKLQEEKLKQAEKAPSDVSYIEDEVLEGLISKQEEEISALELLRKKKLEEASSLAYIQRIDPSYLKDVEAAKKQPNKDEQALLLLAREKQLNETLSENRSVTTNEEEKAAINELLLYNQENIKRLENKLVLSNQLQKQAFISDLRQRLLNDQESLMESTLTSISGLKKQQKALTDYEAMIQIEIAVQEKLLTLYQGDESAKNQLNWLLFEEAQVKTKRAEVFTQMADLEKKNWSEANVTPDLVSNDALSNVRMKEEQLKSAYLNSDDSKLKKQLEKEIKVAQEQRIAVEKKALSDAIERSMLEQNTLKEQLSSNSSVNAKTNALAELASLEMSKKNQNPGDEKETKKQNKSEVNAQQAEKLKSAIAKEELLENLLLQSELSIAEEKLGGTSLQDNENLREQLNYYNLVLMNLEKEEQLLTDNQEERKKVIDKQIKLLQELVKETQSKLEITNDSNTSIQQVILKEVPVSEQRVLALATTKKYQAYYNLVQMTEIAEKESAKLDKEIANERAYLHEWISQNISEKGTETYEKELADRLERFKSLEAKKAANITLRSEYYSQLQLSGTTDSETSEMQYLVNRNITPKDSKEVVASMLDIPVDGLSFTTMYEQRYNNVQTIIPMEVEQPTGLVYRVQVGAFAKPVPEDKFREFRPVSGEKIPNSAITRYLAGYFNNVNKGIIARDQIRQLGYKDAFLVAYCNGKRVSIAEAKELEAKGQCLPMGTNELLIQVTENTVKRINPDTVIANFQPPQVNTSYNEEPGAPKAEAIEKHPGLFYTVQVGLFNRPANAAKIANIPELHTVRLANGQIRYCSGRFDELPVASKRKDQARELGVPDAFVTAYYKGVRIPLQRAKELLMNPGPEVLDSRMSENPIFPIQKAGSPLESDKEPKEATLTELRDLTNVAKPVALVQLVSQKRFESFPIKEMEEMASTGLFYYDVRDQRIKSVLSESKDLLPKLPLTVVKMDTIAIEKEHHVFGTRVNIYLKETTIPGELNDWLIRQSYRFESSFKQGKPVLTVLDLVGIRKFEFEQKMREFGFEYTFE
jgi:hypothetical protein